MTSRLLVPSGIGIDSFVALVTQEVRAPDGVSLEGPLEGPPHYVVFDVTLTAQEQAAYDALVARVNGARDDYFQLGQIRSDIQAAKAALTTYYNLASPTQAQTVAAVKKIIEALNLFLRIFLILLDYLRQR